MSRHAADWTGGRTFADWFIGRSTPGKHHPIRDAKPQRWGITYEPPECSWCEEDRLNHREGLHLSVFGGMEDRAGIAALAKAVTR